MNSRERVFTALDGGTPDRVPYAEMFIDHKVMDALMPGCAADEFIEKYDIDIVTCLTMAEPPDRIRWVDRGEGLWCDKWGALQKNDGNVISVIQDPPVIASIDDLKTYRPPNPDDASVVAEVERLVTRFKGERAIAVVGEEVFAPIQYMRAGLQTLVMDFYDQPDLVHAMVDIAAEYHCALYRKLIGIGAEIIFLGDDYSAKGGPMISPEHFDEFLLPGFRKVVTAIKEAGGYVIKHTDGDCWKMLPLMRNAGVDMFGPLESPYMDLAKVRDTLDVGVMGNVNVDLLGRGGVEEVRAETRALIRQTSAGGRHILSSGNSISNAVRPENFVAMVETVRAHGSYPIKL